jgi:hypothetical protein
VLGAATLADILGISSAPAPKPTVEYSESDVPSKFRKYYRLLIDLRNHVNALIAARKPGVLGATPAESSGDITKVHTHMADSATESFDRDFALSLVANEQEALTESKTPCSAFTTAATVSARLPASPSRPNASRPCRSPLLR